MQIHFAIKCLSSVMIDITYCTSHINFFYGFLSISGNFLTSYIIIAAVCKLLSDRFATEEARCNYKTLQLRYMNFMSSEITGNSIFVQPLVLSNNKETSTCPVTGIRLFHLRHIQGALTSFSCNVYVGTHLASLSVGCSTPAAFDRLPVATCNAQLDHVGRPEKVQGAEIVSVSILVCDYPPTKN